jgi:hypothetical protein
VLGVTAQLFEGLIVKIAKDRMLAQDRKFAARKPASFSCVVLRHGHDHLITSLSIIDGSRPMLGQTRAINPPRFPNYTRRWCRKKGLN